MCVRFEFKIRRIRVQWNQTDAMSKDFVLDHRSVVPNVYMFDGNCRDLVYNKWVKLFPAEEQSERTVPQL